MSLAKSRLAEERKNWRKDRPFGFAAKPVTKADDSVDLQRWKCTVPGKEGTIWEGGHYPVELHFPDDYPAKAPMAFFPAGFVHPNVFPEGKVCLSILNDDHELGGQWAPSISVKQILTGIQELLNDPNLYSPAQEYAYKLLKTNKAGYDKIVKAQALKYRAAEE
eukprot:CAMPEP_0202890994 /NCGR_PEP_ID=MMETSP1392-20130828/1207_1 /ASSEMBLY_ACC=CAM_ASM_000868 /TAXON_ID=225041 /ORGANISM="Chlamydomonas chlamydogama, Strain SAG 11-48b" /LENGTH=163 /DNA_ID=CAMNT_0049574655 /DNA_START=140 /DNA_END=631 /DNA_ORIENTATION=+